MIAQLWFDMLLAGGVLMLAWLSLNTQNIFKSIVLFISLGLFVTLIWARLNAWDVAMAEAAIGAGLTGALLLATWHRLGPESGAVPIVLENKKGDHSLTQDRQHVSNT